MILSIVVVVAVDFHLLLFIVLILREAEKSEKTTHIHMNGVYQKIIYSHYDQFGFEIEVVYVINPKFLEMIVLSNAPVRLCVKSKSKFFF